MGPEREVAGVWCGFVLERLSDYVDGEVEAADRARIEAHLAGCGNCARFGDLFARVVGAVRSAARHTLGPPAP